MKKKKIFKILLKQNKILNNLIKNIPVKYWNKQN